MGIIPVGLEQAAQERNAGEGRTQIVVQVARDALAFMRQGALLLQLFQPAVEFALFHHPRRKRDDGQQTQRGRHAKPPRCAW